MSKSLTHFDNKGNAHMVDVSSKDNTDRLAIAKAKKGDVLSIARVAGIMGCKKTSDLIPLCHPIPLSNVKINLEPNTELPGVDIEAHVKTNGPTGVEMEALTAVTVSCLTIYDMLKAVDKTIEIGNIRLTMKDGGKSGRIENP